MIADHARASQVDLRYATRSEHQTTLAFVRSVAGEPQYAFYDEATASRNWTYRRGSIAFDEIDAIHVGSTTLIDEKTAAETLAMVEDAGGSATISFDPNCRPNLVRHKARYVERMDAFAANADIVRMSDVDFEFLYGGGDYAGRAKSLHCGGCKPRRRDARNSREPRHGTGRRARLKSQAPAVEVVDTIGAGDSFQAALLFALRAIGRIETASLAQANSGRASPRAVVCIGLRGLHLWTRRRRSAATVRRRRGIVSSVVGSIRMNVVPRRDPWRLGNP